MTTAFWDIETRSTVNLETAGVSRYARDPSTEVLCVGYCVDDGQPKIWAPGDPDPEDLFAADEFVAHNFAFERSIATDILTPKHNWQEIPLSKQRDTMSMALAAALEGLRRVVWRVGRERRPGDRATSWQAAMRRIEAAGYPIVLTVHDEIVCEVPEHFGSLEERRQHAKLPRLPGRLPLLRLWSSRQPIGLVDGGREHGPRRRDQTAQGLGRSGSAITAL